MWSILRQSYVLLLLFCIGSSHALARQVTVGWPEEVTIGQNGFSLKAKFDTGTDNSSINTLNARVSTREQDDWAQFSIQYEQGESMVIDQPVFKRIKVKTKSNGLQHRVVINLAICLDGIQKQAEVNLIDRSHFKYQLLIGRSFYAQNF